MVLCIDTTFPRARRDRENSYGYYMCKSLVKNRFLFFFFFFLKCKKLRLSLVLIESGLRMMMHIRIIYQTPLRVAYKNLWSFSMCIYLLFMLDKNLEESLLNVIRSIGGFI